MIITAFDAQGRAYDLGAPSSLRIDRDEEAPADELDASFSLPPGLPDLVKIRAELEGETLFSGLIDELERESSPKGAFLRVTARSREALLLDNEAMPQSYYGPSLKNIFRRHIAPYGFSTYLGDTNYHSGEYRIAKGASEWQVLDKFCRQYLGVRPFLGRDGVLHAQKREYGGMVLFSNKGGFPILSVVWREKYHALVSEVAVQSGGWYSTKIMGERASRLGITRRRYCAAGEGIPAAKRILAAADRASRQVVVTCPCWVPAEPGMGGVVEDETLGRLDGLTVSKSTYTVNSRGERCAVVLQKKSEEAG